MSDFLLLSFENIRTSRSLLESQGVPYLALSPFLYMPLPVESWPPQGTLVMLTSARCFHLFPNLEHWTNRTLFLVGKGTQEAAQALGLSAAFVGQGGGADVVQAAALSGAVPLYHLGGQHLSEPLKQALEKVNHVRIPIYTRQRNSAFFDSKEEIRISAIASPAAAQAISEHPYFSKAPAVCIGETTAAAATAHGLQVAGIAEEPRFEALTRLAISAYNCC